MHIRIKRHYNIKMTEYPGQFVTSKYTADFEEEPIRENAKTPSVRQQTTGSKWAAESSIQKNPRSNSIKPSQTSPNKSQPLKYFNSLTDKQKTEAYFDLYDQNLQLRTQKNELELQIKKLSTQLVRLTKDIKPTTNFELETRNEELLKENKILKAKLMAKPKPTSNRPFTAVPMAKKKVEIQPRIIEKVPVELENELKEREEIIQLLRDQLEATEAELLRAKSIPPKVEIPDLSEEFKEKAIRLAEVENKFFSLEEAMGAQKIYLQHVLSVLDDTQKALREERFKNCDMEYRLKAAEMAAVSAQDLAMKLRDSENEKSQLEIRIKEVIEAYFVLEAGRAENPVNLPAPGIEKLNI